MKYLIILLFIATACSSEDPEPVTCSQLKAETEAAFKAHRAYKLANGENAEEKRLYDIWYSKSELAFQRRCQ